MFVDIKGAFDAVLPDRLVRILENSGIPIKIIKFIEYVRGGKIEAYVGQEHIGNRTISRGVPQGSVLSPLLYLYTAEICKLTPEIDMLMYADDIVFYTCSNSLRLIYDQLEVVLAYICEELSNLGLALSCEKSKLCIFAKKGHIKIQNSIRKYGYMDKLKYAGAQIPLVEKVKFLGI